MRNNKENNYVILAGKIVGKPYISHEIEGEKFWDCCLDVKGYRLQATSSQ